MPEPLRPKKKTKAKRAVELYGNKSTRHIRISGTKRTTSVVVPTVPRNTTR
jgi:hypothetical protein